MSSRAPSLPRVAQRLRRTILRHRRLLAAVLTAVAVGSALQVVRAPTVTATTGPAHPEPRSLGAALVAAHPDLVPLPVRLPDAGMAGLLAPGDRITVLATDAAGTAAETVPVAAGVLVLEVPRGEGADNRVTTPAAGRLVIIGVDPDRVEPVTNAAVRSVLTFSWGH